MGGAVHLPLRPCAGASVRAAAPPPAQVFRSERDVPHGPLPPSVSPAGRRLRPPRETKRFEQRLAEPNLGPLFEASSLTSPGVRLRRARSRTCLPYKAREGEAWLLPNALPDAGLLKQATG